ncbi:hypothetical protein COV19_00515 [Candidatus Woesearchaeota archaeon CG10_big_fil_rev_8_21_14_0_10_44_13]|nr:MAG: hypothetical protein COV19_00515 [Candidatus Woesearchaeota archaeon CG10_big_fil_rev_8_21_14_0_10_44_13]
MIVVHHTPFNFPLDEHFLGETIILGTLVRGYNGTNYVISANSNEIKSKSLPENLPEYVASANFNNANLKRIPYRAKDNADYINFIKSLLDASGGPIILNYHFPRKDLGVTRAMKRQFGSDVATVMHLHCMPELLEPTHYNQSKDNKPLAELLQGSDVDRFIAVSNAVKTAFVYSDLIDGDKISLVNNGVDMGLYTIPPEHHKKELKKKIGINAERVVGYVGRLDKYKGADTILELLRYFERTSEKRYGFVFATSDGAERESFFNKLKHIAPNLIENDQIKIVLDISKLTRGKTSLDEAINSHFLNQLRSEGITGSKAYGGIVTEPIHMAFDYYLHPSKSEAICLAIIEALAVGVPVIASETGGIPDLVHDSNGILIKIKSPDDPTLQNFLAENEEGKNAEAFLDALRTVEQRILDRKISSPDEIRTQVLKGGFTSDIMMEKTMDAYMKAVEHAESRKKPS